MLNDLYSFRDSSNKNIRNQFQSLRVVKNNENLFKFV